MKRRRMLAGLAAGTAALGVYAPPVSLVGEYGRPLNLGSILLRERNLDGYTEVGGADSANWGQIKFLARRFTPNDEATFPASIVTRAAVCYRPGRATRMVNDVGRIDYGQSTRREIDGTEVLYWSGAGGVTIATNLSNLYLDVSLHYEDEENIENPESYMRATLANVPTDSSQ